MGNTHFQKWHHKSEFINTHVNKPSYIAAFQAAEENPEKTISVILDKRRAENIAENRQCVAYCFVVASALHSGETRSNEISQKIMKLSVVDETDSQS